MILANTILLIYQFGTENYRAIIINFKLDNIVGHKVNICTLNTRKLIEDNSLIVARCNNKIKELMVSYKINRRLDTLEDEWDNFYNM